MSKGRKKTPSNLKVVRGTDRADRMNPNEPMLERSRPSAPESLSDIGREAWGYVVARLDRMGVLTEVDADMLELLCEARADWLDARRIIAERGAVYETESGLLKSNPAINQHNDAARRLQSLLSEFGMSPASRTKVSADGSGQDEDPAAAYFL